MEPALQKRLLQRLQNIERKELPTFHVVMLPDFFVDHFVFFETVEQPCHALQTLAAQGGGNLPGVAQRIHQGGNAANTALGLASLGMSSHLICQTTPLGLHLLQYFLGRHGVDLSGVRTDGTLAMTTVVELQNPRANIMLGDPGSVATYRFEQLQDHDHELLASADLVGVTNWNLNRYGTDLACKVFEEAKKHQVKTFFDSGDPSPRIDDIPELFEKVLRNPHLDVFGLNENELRYYSKSTCQTHDEMLAAVKALKRNISARIDVHTSQFSGSAQERLTVVPTLSIPAVYRSTGAGDIWNAANIFADLLSFADDERLLFANIFAGRYIASSEILPPRLDMLINFIKNIL
jgi:sugar/nucleoside kinase (ribokinase family)